MVADLDKRWRQSDCDLWRFRVLDRLVEIDRCYVPWRRMEEKAAIAFLKHLVVQAHRLPAQAAANHFVNRRKGGFVEYSNVFAEHRFCEPKKRIQGYWMSYTNIIGLAELRMSKVVAGALELQRRKNSGE